MSFGRRDKRPPPQTRSQYRTANNSEDPSMCFNKSTFSFSQTSNTHFPQNATVTLPPKNTATSRLPKDDTNTRNQPKSISENSPIQFQVKFGDVMELCYEVSDNEKLKATFKNSGKAGAVTGSVTILGGLLGGPSGIILGGIIGTMAGYWLTKGKFEPLHKVLSEMTSEQKKELCQKLFFGVLRKLAWENKMQLIQLVTGNRDLKEQVIAVIRNFVTDNLGAVLVTYTH